VDGTVGESAIEDKSRPRPIALGDRDPLNPTRATKCEPDDGALCCVVELWTMCHVRTQDCDGHRCVCVEVLWMAFTATLPCGGWSGDTSSCADVIVESQLSRVGAVGWRARNASINASSSAAALVASTNSPGMNAASSRMTTSARGKSDMAE
jgi:hypothetical protein